MCPLKKDFDGEYVKQKLAAGAAKLVAEQQEMRQRELSGQAELERADEHDTLCVAQRPCPPLQGDPLQEPRVLWATQGTMPFGMAPIEVSASQSEALRNKQSISDLLSRRLRRVFREQLQEGKWVPAEDINKRVMRLNIAIADVSLIVKPGEG